MHHCGPLCQAFGRRFITSGQSSGATMTEVADYPLDDGSVVQIQYVPDARAGARPVGGDRTSERVSQRLGSAVGAAREVLDAARALGADSVEVKFGITLTAGLTWAVAHASAESSFEVTLAWATTDPASAPQPQSGDDSGEFPAALDS
jgi:hypothetical protein